MNIDLLGAIIALAFVAITLLIALTSNDRRPEAPATTKVHHDHARGPLVAHALALTAQPDQVVTLADGTVAIIAHLTGLAPAMVPRAAALTQAATALVVEEALGVAPTRAIWRYQDRDLDLLLTPALRDLARRRIAVIRANEDHGPTLTRQDVALCRACAYRSLCPIGRANGAIAVAGPGGTP